MSEHLPDITDKDFIELLKKIGFEVARTTGSHHRLKHPDGRVTTVPVHKNDSLPKGLLQKIIRNDLQMTVGAIGNLL